MVGLSRRECLVVVGHRYLHVGGQIVHGWCSVVNGAGAVAVAAIRVRGCHGNGQTGAESSEGVDGTRVHRTVGVRGVGYAGC